MHYLAFHDKKQHGTSDFPAEYYFVDKKHPQYVMPFHWHKEWELIHIRKGTFHLRTDSLNISADTGDLLLLSGNTLHGGMPEDCEYECFVFDLHGMFRNGEAVKKNLRPIYQLQLIPQLHYPAKQYDSVHDIAEKIFATCRQPETNCYALMLTCFLGLFFAHLLSAGLCTDKTKALSHNSDRIEQIKNVLEYIEQQFAQPITLSELAAVAHLNAKYFCRVFRELTQQTPMEYVIHYRIEQAAALLAGTDLPMLTIASECGFNNYSYFIRTFQRLRGITPRQYRRDNRK